MTKNGKILPTWQLHKLEQALQKDPENAAIHLDLSNVYLSLAEFDKAKQHLYQALRLNPNYAEGYNNLGRLLYKQSLFSEAIPYFEKALRLHPEYFEAHYNLANSFSQLNNFNRALFHYQKAVALHPQHIDAQHNLGLVLFEAEKYNEAEGPLQIAWEASKQSASGLILGQTFLALGKIEQAKKLYESLLEKDDTLTEAHHNLGIIFLWAHEHEKALKQFEKVLSIDPSNETAKHMAHALKGETPKEPPPTQYVKDLFDQYADHYDLHVKEKLHYQAPYLLRNAFGHCKGINLKTGRVLDLGCGTGLSGIYFRDLATELVGIDISPKMIEKSKVLGAYDELHTIEILEYLNNTVSSPFNFIIAADVLVYFGDLSALFKGVVRHLVWGGYFSFTIEMTEPDQMNSEMKHEMKNETTDKQDFCLQTTGRFAHSAAYIQTLAKDNDMQIELMEKVILRKNAEVDISGGLYILKRC